MVFFSCGACGESLKKNQVEKHYTLKCRNCQYLSCVDCGVEFWGDDYISHNKCISEEEKYHGSLYKKNPDANKGEQKQELWTEQVIQAISKTKGNPSLINLLERLKEYPNIPRKKAKFENFLKNSLRVQNQALVSQAWSSISAEIEASRVSDEKTNLKNGSTDITLQSTLPDNSSQTTCSKENDLNEDLSAVSKSSSKKRCNSDESSSTGKRFKAGESCTEETRPFRWRETITEVLKEAPNNQLKIKKLRKKVLAKLREHKPDTNISEEEMMSKFDKKISKHSGLTLENNIVLLQM